MSRAKARILCIDDHWNGLIGRKMLLEQSGYEVLEASGGDEGLKLFRKHAVDAVVLDYQMPGMNGDVVAAKMKRINARVPIMMLSAYEPLPRTQLPGSKLHLTGRSKVWERKIERRAPPTGKLRRPCMAARRFQRTIQNGCDKEKTCGPAILRYSTA